MRARFNSSLSALGLGAALLALSGCGRSADEKSTSRTAVVPTAASDPIALAISAAPPAVTRDAAVATVAGDGTVRTLRKGANNITCIPDDVKTQGSDPLCADANGLKWLVSWMTGKSPPDAPGLVYMMSIGRAAAPAGQSPLPAACLKIGPHLMIVAAPDLLAGYPSASPGGKAPFVMSASTPYAHLVVPVG